MYTYKLTRVVFNDGTTIEPGRLTVIVGPNNAGKSRALQDIIVKTTTERQEPGIIVRRCEWTLPQNLQELRAAYDFTWYQDEDNVWHYTILTPDLSQELHIHGGFPPTAYEDDQFQRPREEVSLDFARSFGEAMVTFLTTEHRLQLVKEAPSQSYRRHAANLLQALYNAGREVEQIIRELVKQAFGREIALDFTVPQRLLLRVGDDFSRLPLDPREAASTMIQHAKLDEQGDGIRSFVGIVVAMLSIKRSLVLIDEPEAFLHPPHAFRIGAFLADQANNKRQIILATHSADVLRGMLSKTRDVTILRMDRAGSTNSFQLLDPERLKELVTDPLLSSARVLDGLFYPGAVVVEADADARFYHAVSNKRRADIDLHFVNADNKHTVPRITKMYRDMGVRCAGIVDFDVLNERRDFERQLQALEFGKEETEQALVIREAIAQAAKEIPPEKRLEHVQSQMTALLADIHKTQSLQVAPGQEASSAKAKLLRQIERKCGELADATKSWKQFKKEGRAALSRELQSQFDQLWEMCARKGLFIIPCGELESMLTEYGIEHTSDKRAWITRALILLPGLEVNNEKYPWKFVAAIHEHLARNKDDSK